MLFTTRTRSAGAAIGAVAVVCAVTDITGSVHLASRSERRERGSIKLPSPAIGRGEAGESSAHHPPRFAKRDEQASARFVTRLRALRPAGVRAHVVLGGLLDQRIDLLLDRR